MDKNQPARDEVPPYPAQQGARYLPQFQHQQDYPPPAQVYPPLPEGFPPAQPQQDFMGGPPGSLQDAPPAYESSLDNTTALLFSDKAIRRAFIRKVYLTLMVQLLITVGIICMFIYWQTLKLWVLDNYWFTYTLLVVTFVLLLILVCCDTVRRKVPLNFIFLGLFTVAEGLMLGAISAFYNADAVMWAIGATAFVTFGLSLFALQTKWDFTMFTGVLCTIGLVLLAFAILCAIIRSLWLQIVYASVGTLVFALYLVVDTQLMLGGNHKYSLNPEEYIFAALNLYLDIINMFLFLLQIFQLCE
uniref:Zgc:110410 n=2 Tax=Latimeria chalumnae TaxID=7897 RepID=M3XJB9_LATCH|nr:PREDICTED: protein lifeguard 1 isoform X2 [Latimeria chalumnae]|eukprot:XP_014347937.1 PREDICTED: protein lifeguard 1 isoform X2 [Latimeria chalumnae]